MKTSKRLISLLLSVLMVLGAVSVGFSASAEGEYLYVGGQQLDLENGGQYFDGKVVYNPDDLSLTFNNYELTGFSGNCVSANKLDFTLTIRGSATLEATGNLYSAINAENTNIILDCDSISASSERTLNNGGTINVLGLLTINGGSISAVNNSGSYAVLSLIHI